MQIRVMSNLVSVLFHHYLTLNLRRVFPHHVGDRRDYYVLNTGQVFSSIITKDSIGEDGSHNIFIIMQMFRI